MIILMKYPLETQLVFRYEAHVDDCDKQFTNVLQKCHEE
jgi:hypothetical protein